MLSTLRRIPSSWLAAAGGVIVAIPFVVDIAFGREAAADDLEVPAYVLWWLLLVVALMSRIGDDSAGETRWKKLLRTTLVVSGPAVAVILIGVLALFLSDAALSEDLLAALAIGIFFAGLLLAVALATWGVVLAAAWVVQQSQRKR